MRRLAAAVAFVLLLASCGGGADDGAGPDRTAGVYEAVLTAVVAQEAPPVEGEPAPIVYAIPAGNEPIPATVQVQVVKALKDDVDLRFADTRDDAVDTSKDGEPVHDDGLLVALGPVPDEGTSVDVPIVLYRSTADERPVVVTVTQGSTTWTVSSTAPGR